jgi:hypothetical protein
MKIIGLLFGLFFFVIVQATCYGLFGYSNRAMKIAITSFILSIVGLSIWMRSDF